MHYNMHLISIFQVGEEHLLYISMGHYTLTQYLSSNNSVVQ